MIGKPTSTMSIPPAKKAVPFNLCDWKKNLYVRSIPMIKMIPARNRIWGAKWNTQFFIHCALIILGWQP